MCFCSFDSPLYSYILFGPSLFNELNNIFNTSTFYICKKCTIFSFKKISLSYPELDFVSSLL